MARLGQALASVPFNPEWASEGHDARELLIAADEHRALMAPADPDFTRSTLRGLRSATILRDEDGKEALATFNILRVHLADVPADILQEACRRYVNKSGARFFPRSAGELRAFTGPLMIARAVREDGFRRMAAAAEERARRAEREAAFVWTAENIRLLPRRIAQQGVGKGWYSQAVLDDAFPPEPPPGDAELALG